MHPVTRRILLGAAFALVLAPAAVPAATGLPRIVESWAGPAVVRPRAIHISGDASLFYAGKRSKSGHATSLRWTSYSKTSAVATGYEWVDDCDPNCADGAYHLDGPLKLRFTEVAKGRFTRLTITGGHDLSGERDPARPTTLRLTGSGRQQGWG